MGINNFVGMKTWFQKNHQKKAIFLMIFLYINILYIFNGFCIIDKIPTWLIF